MNKVYDNNGILLYLIHCGLKTRITEKKRYIKMKEKPIRKRKEKKKEIAKKKETRKKGSSGYVPY